MTPGSPPGSSGNGALQARILERAAVSFSRDLPDLGIEPGPPALQVDSLPSEPTGGSPINTNIIIIGLKGKDYSGCLLVSKLFTIWMIFNESLLCVR